MEPVNVTVNYLGWKTVVLEGCKTVGDVMARVAVLEDRFACEVSVFASDAVAVLSAISPPPPEVSVVLRQKGTALEYAELRESIYLHASNKHIPACMRILRVLQDTDRAGDALMEASRDGHKEVVDLLLKAGVRKRAGYALALASEEGHKEVVDLFLKAGVREGEGDALKVASYQGHKEVVDLLLKAGFREGAGDALMDASREGHKEVVDLLLKAGVREGAGRALEAASFRRRPDVVELLSQAGVREGAA